MIKLAEVFGVSAGVLKGMQMIPQALALYHGGDHDDLHIGSLLLNMLSCVCFLIYGVPKTIQLLVIGSHEKQHSISVLMSPEQFAILRFSITPTKFI